MKQTPVAISLLLCEQVNVDNQTRTVTPVNCFNSRELESFPGQTTFYAVMWMTNGEGEMPLQVIVERLDSLEHVFRLDRTVRFANPLDEMRCTVRIRDCELPVPGQYQVSLWIDRELIALRKFTVGKQGE